MTGPLSNTYFFRYRGDDYPTKKYVLELHDDVLEVSEGRPGVAHIGVIESAVNKPVTSIMGEDAYPTFFTKVAAIGYTLAHDHGFSDGNKRTALQVMLNTLEENGFYPDPSEREKVTVAVLAAMDMLQVPGLRVALMLWCGIDPADREA
ncbi:type II toxin-antitoxin system death-on-curing family toxin [Deinococcus sp. HMF7620]|uniref:Type II toxin-antitoxin system death-on-curing family toxin n=1 Tax=Deinococcus arboris TaxID=2682977 RepID=A0A7C9LJZ8_9DEIO|nr:type II toxin-antitoxin system death-on-curing family toxin [Deinococcus arboris]MVN85437.1 type II toxin-antitoxin system death-on-curing family toxin [Deinococcus arboris]